MIRCHELIFCHPVSLTGICCFSIRLEVGALLRRCPSYREDARPVLRTRHVRPHQESSRPRENSQPPLLRLSGMLVFSHQRDADGCPGRGARPARAFARRGRDPEGRVLPLLGPVRAQYEGTLHHASRAQFDHCRQSAVEVSQAPAFVLLLCSAFLI